MAENCSVPAISNCNPKAAFDHEIGLASRDYEDYCLNAPTMKALNQDQVAIR